MIEASAHIATWCISSLGVLGVIVRPWKLPEAVWAVLAASALMALSLVSYADAIDAVQRGSDVYLFLLGMMLLAELARQEGLFDWLAAVAVREARGSPARLFWLVYLVGAFVTIFLSNDATAVVMTPAVYAAAKRADVEPLPYLFICAMIANAASFVLPISNPANLVVYGSRIPSLGRWLADFGLPSIAAIALTYVALRFSQRRALTGTISGDPRQPRLSRGGRMAAGGILLTAVVLLGASALGLPLGAATFVVGTSTAATLLFLNRSSPWSIVKDISWSVLPLVAGLFILVEAVKQTGVLEP